MTTYVLMYDPTGANAVTFTVPAGKVVYLVRAPQVSEGNATVRDYQSATEYVLQDGLTVRKLAISAGTQVQMAFVARTNDDIQFVNVEVTRSREDGP